MSCIQGSEKKSLKYYFRKLFFTTVWTDRLAQLGSFKDQNLKTSTEGCEELHLIFCLQICFLSSAYVSFFVPFFFFFFYVIPYPIFLASNLLTPLVSGSGFDIPLIQDIEPSNSGAQLSPATLRFFSLAEQCHTQKVLSQVF